MLQLNYCILINIPLQLESSQFPSFTLLDKKYFFRDLFSLPFQSIPLQFYPWLSRPLISKGRRFNHSQTSPSFDFKAQWRNQSRHHLLCKSRRLQLCRVGLILLHGVACSNKFPFLSKIQLYGLLPIECNVDPNVLIDYHETQRNKEPHPFCLPTSLRTMGKSS